MRPAHALFLLALLSDPASAPNAAAESNGAWEPVLDEEGIRVWRREVEGSPLIEFRGSGEVRAPIRKVAAVIRNVERQTRWVKSCVTSVPLAWASPTEVVFYNRTASPVFFVSDRDVVVRVALRVLAKERALLVEFRNTTHPKAPPIDGVVRVPHVRGHWRLEPAGPDATIVEYRVHADPGGALPHWLVNWVSRRLPLDTLSSLRREVLDPAYEADAVILESAIDWSLVEPSRGRAP